MRFLFIWVILIATTVSSDNCLALCQQPALASVAAPAVTQKAKVGVRNFPPGVIYLDEPLIIGSNETWVGAGVRVTTLVCKGNFPAIRSRYADVAGRAQFVSISGMSINGRKGNTAPVLDLRGTSYMTLRDLYIDAKYSDGPCIDHRVGDARFNGYVELTNVYCFRGQYGYLGQANQLRINGGMFNVHSKYGIAISNCANVSLIGCDLSLNGTRERSYGEYVGTYPKGHYDRGGILLKNVTNVTAHSLWFERNANREQGQYSPNDVDNDWRCKSLKIWGCRWDNARPGKIHLQGLDWGQDYGEVYTLPNPGD